MKTTILTTENHDILCRLCERLGYLPGTRGEMLAILAAADPILVARLRKIVRNEVR